jgi:hypothetical protein
MLRIGNDHLAPSRGALIPWTHHFGELFVVGVVVFWIIAMLQYRRISHGGETIENATPHGVLLR